MPWYGTLAHDDEPRLEWIVNDAAPAPCPGWAIMVPIADAEWLNAISGNPSSFTEEFKEKLAEYLTDRRLPLPPLDGYGWVVAPDDPSAVIDVLERS